MNLLNGLAVSDTGVIQENAKVHAYLSTVETISYAESLLLGDPFNFLASVPSVKLFSSIPSLSCCRQIYKSRTARRLFQKVTGAQGILLFYNFLPDKQLVHKPNSRDQDCLKLMRVGQDIVDAAKTIVLNKEKEAKRKMTGGVEEELARLSNKNRDMEKQLEETVKTNRDLVDKLSSLEHKIDLLLHRF